MRVNSIELLKSFRDRYVSGPAEILDIGSMDLHGNGNNAKAVFHSADVLGADIAPGPNVDVVIREEENYPLLCAGFDVVVSSNVFEHVKRPWKLFRWAVSNLKHGGHIFVVAPFSFEYRRHPVDCWRYTPDSFAVLCEDSGVTLLESEITRWCGTTVPLIRDIAWWLIKKRDPRTALQVLRNCRHRVPHYDCHMIGRRT